jgi:hypothetical protein
VAAKMSIPLTKPFTATDLNECLLTHLGAG